VSGAGRGRIEQDVWSPLIRQVVEAVPPDERAGAFDLLVFSCCLLQRILPLMMSYYLPMWVLRKLAVPLYREPASHKS